jgi:hypothetical protein
MAGPINPKMAAGEPDDATHCAFWAAVGWEFVQKIA